MRMLWVLILSVFIRQNLAVPALKGVIVYYYYIHVVDQIFCFCFIQITDEVYVITEMLFSSFYRYLFVTLG